MDKAEARICRRLELARELERREKRCRTRAALWRAGDLQALRAMPAPEPLPTTTAELHQRIREHEDN